MNCVHALQSFLEELQQLEQHYMHLEWVVEHEKEIMSSLKNVRKQCPYFHE
jgi:predicted RNA-binding protein with EMAP domain